MPTTKIKEPAQGNYSEYSRDKEDVLTYCPFFFNWLINQEIYHISIAIFSVWRKCLGQTAQYAWKIFTLLGFLPTYLHAVT